MKQITGKTSGKRGGGLPPGPKKGKHWVGQCQRPKQRDEGAPQWDLTRDGRVKNERNPAGFARGEN